MSSSSKSNEKMRARKKRTASSTARQVWQVMIANAPRMLPPIATSLILAILVLIPRVQRFIGPYAFLAFPFMQLFFRPSPTVGEHVETVSLGLIGGAIGLGLSTFALWGITQVTTADEAIYGTPAARAIGACTLVTLCFLGGLVSSSVPRLKNSVRIGLFSITWSLSVGAEVVTAPTFTNLLYPVILAALASLAATLALYPKSASNVFAARLVLALNTCRDIVRQTVVDFEAPGSAPSARLLALRRTLQSCNLEGAHEAAALEISLARVPCAVYQPMLDAVRRTRVWVSCGMGLSRTSTKDEAAQSQPNSSGFHEPIAALAAELESSFTLARSCVQLTLIDPPWWAIHRKASLAQPFDLSQGDDAPDRAVLRQRKQLHAAVSTFRESLQSALDSAGRSTATHVAWVKPADALTWDSDLYATAFLMVSLLELSREAASVLHTAQRSLRFWHAHPRRRPWWPLVTSRDYWARSGGGTLNNLIGTLQSDYDGLPASEPRRNESSAGLDYFESVERKPAQDLPDIFAASDDDLPVTPGHESGVRGKVQKLSRRPGVLRARLALARALEIKGSRHLRYAFKLALGVALLSLPLWIPSGRQWYVDNRGQWLVISYIWCLETSTGATLRVCLYRIIGTFAGALFGLLAWIASNRSTNRPALAFFLTLAELPGTYLISYTRAPGIGVVFAITHPIIALIPAADELRGESVPHLALLRGWQILLGIVAALIVNTTLWPWHARTYLQRHLARTTSDLQRVYLGLSRQMMTAAMVPSPASAARFAELEADIQTDLKRCRVLLDLMHAELSLAPKPTRILARAIDALQRAADLLAALRQVRETGMRSIHTEAVVNVLELRRDLISSVLLALWMAGTAIRTHTPLPQFLPSANTALQALTEALKSRQSGNSSEAATLLAHSSGVAGASGVSTVDSWMPRSRTTWSARASQSEANTPPTRPGTPVGTPMQQQRVPAPSGKSVIGEHGAHFFLLAEHALLADIVAELDALLDCVRDLVGEATFLRSTYLPREEEPLDPHVLSMTTHHHTSQHLQSALAQQAGVRADTLQQPKPRQLASLFERKDG